jgi:hypothetical protein
VYNVNSNIGHEQSKEKRPSFHWISNSLPPKLSALFRGKKNQRNKLNVSDEVSI